MLKCLAVTLTLVLLGTPALADNQQQADPKSPPADKIVCKTEATVGSMIPKRICMKKSEWEQGAANGKEFLGKLQQLQIDAKSLSPSGG